MPDEAKQPAAPKPLTTRQLQEALRRSERELALVETQYTATLFRQLIAQESQQPAYAQPDVDENRWQMVSSGGQYVDEKNLVELNRDPQLMRRQAYRFWRLNPHGRSILRNFVRFIVGREFAMDFDDEQHGAWNEDHTKLVASSDDADPLMVRELWDDFAERNRFIQKAKELVLRTFRDGEAFVRRFVKNGRVTLRFVEPERVGWGMGSTTTAQTEGVVRPEDVDTDDLYAALLPEHVGERTGITGGVEYLADDPEVIVAYWIRYGSGTPERVPAKDVIHTKPLADANDLRGIPLLEIVAKQLTNYSQWEEYRMILNKMRTAVALVRKIEGTQAQASALIARNASSRPQPTGREPVTQSGRREAMFPAGTILNPSPGVSYDFLSPKLDARDAGEDGRRFLLTISAGVGLPEMLITGDWANANYASAVESRTPAVREWEDWQDFFEPEFTRIFRWVVQAGFALGLPKDTSQKVEIQWPALIAKDHLKNSQRNQLLNAGGIMSKTTWAAQEDLSYEDELDNMVMEAELEGARATPDTEDDAAAEAKYRRGAVARKAKDPGGIPEGGKRQPGGPSVSFAEAQLLLRTLDELEEQVDSSVQDPAMLQAMTRYIGTARQVAGRVGRRKAGERKRQRRWGGERATAKAGAD